MGSAAHIKSWLGLGIPGVTSYFVLDGGQWRDCVSSVRFDPALNGYLEKHGEGKQGGCAKALHGWVQPPPPPYYNSWVKGHEMEISTAGYGPLNGLVRSYLTLTYWASFEKRREIK